MGESEHSKNTVAGERAFVLATREELLLLGSDEDGLQELLSRTNIPFPTEEAHARCRAAIQLTLERQDAAKTTEDTLNNEARDPDSPLRQLIRAWLHQVLAKTLLQG